MSETLDIVIPLLTKDLDRCQILLRSLERFWTTPGTVHVFAREEELSLVRRALPASVAVHLKRSVIGRGPYDRGLDGWYRQMLVKLGAATIVGSDFYLAMDADMIAKRPLTYADFVHGAQGLFRYSAEPETKRKWYEGAARLLCWEQELPRPLSFTPPFVFNTQGAARLLKDLVRGSEGWDDTLTTDRLDRQGRWTEAALYHLSVLRHGLWDTLHVEASEPLAKTIFDFGTATPGGVDRAPAAMDQARITDAMTRWDAAEAFSGPEAFTIIHSRTKIPADWIWERVKPFLDHPALPILSVSA